MNLINRNPLSSNYLVFYSSVLFVQIDIDFLVTTLTLRKRDHN